MGAYLRLQSNLSSRSTVDDYSRACEVALDSILDAAERGAPLTDEDCSRAIRSAARRERGRAALRRRYLPSTEPQVDPRPSLEARSELRLIHSRVTASDWRLLTNIAIGRTYDEVADVTPANARVRVLRLRRKVAA